jgi:hypothetical protein
MHWCERCNHGPGPYSDPSCPEDSHSPFKFRSCLRIMIKSPHGRGGPGQAKGGSVVRRAIISPSVTNRSSLKSGISAAIFDGEREASQSVIGRKPCRPAVSASQNSFRPVPIALTGPTPVITAEFFSIFLLCKIIPEIPDQQGAAGSLSVRVQDNMGGTRLVSRSNIMPSPPGSRRGCFHLEGS